MSSELLRIAVSGLVANQAALTTTGHNISNAGVDGYSRQRVDFDTRSPQLLNGAFFGRGVDIGTVSRMVDDFTIRQLRVDTFNFAAADTIRTLGEQVDSILSDPAIGVSPRIDSFFSSLQTAADDPTWMPSRQVVLGEANTLAQRFNAMYDRLDQVNTAINTQLGGVAQDITSLASRVAELNQQIELAVGASGGDQPNDLLDQRDQALVKLAELADITTVEQGNFVNVFLGKGQSLVVGAIANSVQSVQGQFDPSRNDLAMVVNGKPRVISDAITGGKAGGLISFRERVLDPAFNRIGRVAIGLAADVNEQHQLGLDAEGDFGGLVFSDVNGGLAPTLRARAANNNDPASTGVISVDIADSSLLTTSSYQFDVLTGGAWRLYRNDDKTVVASGAALPGGPLTVDGMTLNLNLPTGNFVAGDSFLIDPTRRGAKEFGVVIGRPEDLALAQPVRAEPVSGNTGTGAASVANVFDTSIPLFTTTAGQLAPPLVIRFTSATTFDVLNNSNPENPVALVPPRTGLVFTPGVTNTLFSTNPAAADYFGFQVQMTGAPQAGDRFALGFNTGGISDNRNAVALANLQTADNLASGTATYQSAYGQLVGLVGSQTRQARIDADASSALVEQTKAAREARSGVNMDEEAANLIRFQQAYNATAQLIAVARDTIDSLLKITG